MPDYAPRRALYIKCTDQSSILEREDIINSLRVFATDDRLVVTNMKDLLRQTDTATFVLDIFSTIGTD